MGREQVGSVSHGWGQAAGRGGWVGGTSMEGQGSHGRGAVVESFQSFRIILKLFGTTEMMVFWICGVPAKPNSTQFGSP